MRTHLPRLHRGGLVKAPLLVLMALTCTACFTTTRLQPSVEHILPYSEGGIQLPKVRQAILAGCADREWKCSAQGENMINGHLRVREHEVKVKIKYSKSNLLYLYQSSKNMKAEDGQIHKKYYMWLEALTRSIKKNLQSAAAPSAT